MSWWMSVLAVSLGLAAGYQEPPPLRVVYFVPGDREPLPGYRGKMMRKRSA